MAVLWWQEARCDTSRNHGTMRHAVAILYVRYRADKGQKRGLHTETDKPMAQKMQSGWQFAKSVLSEDVSLQATQTNTAARRRPSFLLFVELHTAFRGIQARSGAELNSKGAVTRTDGLVRIASPSRLLCSFPRNASNARIKPDRSPVPRRDSGFTRGRRDRRNERKGSRRRRM